MPGKQAGSEAVQQHKDRLALPHHLDMDGQPIDLDELAVRIGQLFRRDGALKWRDRNEKRSDQYDE